MRKIICIILAVCMCSMFLCACGSSKVDHTSKNKNDVVGKWYNEDDLCLKIRSDGTWKLDNNYGSGKWKMLDDETVEFTDSYGEIQETEIFEDDLGEYVEFGYYGNFYKDEYPSKDGDTLEEDDSNDDVQPTTEAPTEPPVIAIDPFENLSYEVTGVSPYCKVIINNSECSEDAQLYVTYTLDKEYYANGETAIISATLSSAGDYEGYGLESTETAYTISNQPEYITSVKDVDLSLLEAELSDYITANTTAAVGNWGLFDIHAAGNSFSVYQSVDEIQKREVYFTSIKKIKEHSDMDFYNSLNFVYSISATMKGGSIYTPLNVNVYVNISAYNIIKYPDGTIKWGKSNPDSYDFASSASTNSVDYMVTTCISVLAGDYNITRVEQ